MQGQQKNRNPVLTNPRFARMIRKKVETKKSTPAGAPRENRSPAERRFGTAQTERGFGTGGQKGLPGKSARLAPLQAERTQESLR